MIELHDLPSPHPRRPRKRVGRGPGSGKGKTSGRGEKGQNSRSGGGVPAWFEGGQMPLQRRIPKRGFKNRNRKEYQVVNVGELGRVSGAVSPEALRAAGLIRSLRLPVKLLGGGEVESPVECLVHAASASARSKIEAAGGSVTLLAARGGPADSDSAEEAALADEAAPAEEAATVQEATVAMEATVADEAAPADAPTPTPDSGADD